ncbi:hypothetical protein FQN53_007580 [Emmonsiellopsis sp. PD_33]|nr:hypothetical protein FQN53_007580 [Emmonsiellopsis sp. PD_33]
MTGDPDEDGRAVAAVLARAGADAASAGFFAGGGSGGVGGGEEDAADEESGWGEGEVHCGGILVEIDFARQTWTQDTKLWFATKPASYSGVCLEMIIGDGILGF